MILIYVHMSNLLGKLPFELVPEMLREDASSIQISVRSFPRNSGDLERSPFQDDMIAFYNGLNLQLATDFEDFKDVLVTYLHMA